MRARRIAVARALFEAGGQPVSGEALASELGISRAAVGKHVAALREAGFVIESTHHTGHRLVKMSSVSLPEAVAPLVTASLWVRFEGGATVASTSDDAKRLASGGAPEGTVVVAARQESGRGRLGRSWESPEGGAYFSAVLRPNVAPAAVSSLALVIALGVATGLASLGVDTKVKWPNDVLLDGRKLVGVLLEMSAEADRVEWVVVGVGINVRRPKGDAGGFAYVADVAAGIGPAQVAAAALDGISVAYRRYAAEGFAGLAADYAQLDAVRGRDVAVRDATGAVVASGIAGGVDESGRLIVGETPVFSGEVTLRDGTGGEA
ncbi:MAG: biotin--[acetyl-CoA-carboxylase] ligase [Coriobacteriia bacterium]|nr:biotin--[acetyl-CoA-carboxylase] ligase [Coriobacteriia bacterium]